AAAPVPERGRSRLTGAATIMQDGTRSLSTNHNRGNSIMKKAILTLAALAAFSTSASAQEVLRVGTEGAYAPWNFVNDAGELAGFEIDLANAICEQTGMTCEIVQNDWDSIIPNLVAGNYDTIMAGMSITEERLESINFTQDYFPVDPS